VPGETPALGVESGRAAVDVIVACTARRELELAKAEAVASQYGEQFLGVS